MEEKKIYWVFRDEDHLPVFVCRKHESKSVLEQNFMTPSVIILKDDEVPADWQLMDVVDGKLVEPSPEVLAERKIEYEAEQENRRAAQVRSDRRTAYEAETDPMLFEAFDKMAASGNYPELTEWLERKNEIRRQLPIEKQEENAGA